MKRFALLFLLLAAPSPPQTMLVVQHGESAFTTIYIDGVKQESVERSRQCITLRAVRDRPNVVRIRRMGFPDQYLREYVYRRPHWRLDIWWGIPATTMPEEEPCK